jgi:K+-transporting ATPase KdpF subunit
MGTMLIVCAVLAAGLFFYLAAALLRPERF